MAFQHGLSGINAATKQLNAIGNNVSNANTVGFKGSRAEFADMFAANFYGVAATQTGIGVATSTVAQQFGQGNITTTGNQLDLAISGNGFFVMKNSNGYSYTRNGQFQIDREGYINNSGDKLMGWAVDANNQVKNGTLTELKVDNSLLAPRASDYPNNTGKTTLELNLDSRSAAFALPATTTGASVAGTMLTTSAGNSYTLATALPAAPALTVNTTAVVGAGAPAAGTYTVTNGADNWTLTVDAAGNVSGTRNVVPAFNPADPKTYTHTTALTAYDSLGNPIQVSTYYVKTGANTWDVYATATADKGATVYDIQSGAPFTSPATALGQIKFDSYGKLVSTALTPTPVDVKLGGDPVTFNFDFTGTTQFGTNFAVNTLTQPGYASSVITSLLIDKTGVMSAKYSNGQTKTIGQVVLANFANLQGLQSIGNNRLIESYASGTPTLNDPGSTNVGLIQSQAQEDSNVDMTTELVNMISAQRYYQANAQTIKVEDQLMQSLISLR